MQTVSVGLPQSIFRKLERVAELTHRSVQDILVSTINAALVEPPNLPPDLANELAALYLFSDQALWAAAQPGFVPSEQARLEQLNHCAGQRPLTESEKAEHEYLLAAYHRSVLRRAKALAILAQRGHLLPIEIYSKRLRFGHWRRIGNSGRATIRALFGVRCWRFEDNL